MLAENFQFNINVYICRYKFTNSGILCVNECVWIHVWLNMHIFHLYCIEYSFDCLSLRATRLTHNTSIFSKYGSGCKRCWGRRKVQRFIIYCPSGSPTSLSWHLEQPNDVIVVVWCHTGWKQRLPLSRRGCILRGPFNWNLLCFKMCIVSSS